MTMEATEPGVFRIISKKTGMTDSIFPGISLVRNRFSTM